MENYLYFAESVVETGGTPSTPHEAIMVPAKDFLYADPYHAQQTYFYFKNIQGVDEGMTRVRLTHGSNNNKAVIKAFMACINASPSSGGFIVVADAETGTATTKSANFNPLFGGDVTAVDIQDVITGNDIAVSGTTYGTGAISSYSAPVLKRRVQNDVIITTLWLDLTVLVGHGDTANDVIGVKAAAPPAYVYRNVVADNGIIFRTEMSCIELPAGNNNVDINLVWNSSATLGYSNAGGTTYGIDGGTWVAGITRKNLLTPPTADHYAYLTEGDTDGDDSVFTAGQFLITFHGIPVDANPSQ